MTAGTDRALTVVSKYVARCHVVLNRRSRGPAGQPVPRRRRPAAHPPRPPLGAAVHPPPLLHARDGADLVVAASNGGIDGEPKWWLNLQADPHGEVEVAGRRFALVASG